MGRNQPVPEWKKDVDRDMRQYLVWDRIIAQQENIILTHQLTGIRTTPVYELREGQPGGPSVNQAERIAVDINLAERRIAAGKAYRANIERIIRDVAAGDEDRETFIRRYWFCGLNMSIRQRSACVTASLDYLAHHSWKTGKPGTPNRTFRNWRNELYRELAELMGYMLE